MIPTANAPQQAALRVAHTYGTLVTRHRDLQAQLGVLEGALLTTYAAAQIAIPAAFAACADSAAWEALYAPLVGASGSAVLLHALPLPRPQDGSWPASWGGLPGVGATMPRSATPRPAG